MRKNGFTMIEMLLVMTIIFMAISISYSTFTPVLKKKNIDFFVAQFRQDLFYAQSYAMTHDHSVKVTIDEANSKYYIFGSGWKNEILSRTIPPTIKFQFLTLDANIIFYPNGNIQKAGKLNIQSSKYMYSVVFYIGSGKFDVKKV